MNVNATKIYTFEECDECELYWFECPVTVPVVFSLRSGPNLYFDSLDKAALTLINPPKNQNLCLYTAMVNVFFDVPFIQRVLCDGCNPMLPGSHMYFVRMLAHTAQSQADPNRVLGYNADDIHLFLKKTIPRSSNLRWHFKAVPKYCASPPVDQETPIDYEGPLRFVTAALCGEIKCKRFLITGLLGASDIKKKHSERCSTGRKKSGRNVKKCPIQQWIFAQNELNRQTRKWRTAYLAMLKRGENADLSNEYGSAWENRSQFSAHGIAVSFDHNGDGIIVNHNSLKAFDFKNLMLSVNVIWKVYEVDVYHHRK